MKVFNLNKSFIKTICCAAVVSAVSMFSSFAQITTANEFFKSVSDFYASFKDYQVHLDIKINKSEMSANLTYMAPDKMRLDFSKPAEQCIVYDGKQLVCYLPDSGTILVQEASGHSGANMASSEGLALLRRCYSVSYEKGQAPTPLDGGDGEPVIKLVLHRRNGGESFRVIYVAVDPQTRLIRRMIGITPGGVSYQFDFSGYDINQGLSEKRFHYDIPSGANTYNDFLIGE
ncbi:MAG: outer membrane lipoprotein carrier protein LolA [Treponema sp.]|nr:outer membrane lipoprotein carrier protein LolA [Treponema sp.]